MESSKKQIKKPGIFRIIIAAVLFFVLALLVTTMVWCMGYWHDITVDEILFHLNAPIEGTAENVMTAFYLKALLPAVIAGGRGRACAAS
jgi:phosphoglycerol transferase